MIAVIVHKNKDNDDAKGNRERDRLGRKQCREGRRGDQLGGKLFPTQKASLPLPMPCFQEAKVKMRPPHGGLSIGGGWLHLLVAEAEIRSGRRRKWKQEEDFGGRGVIMEEEDECESVSCRRDAIVGISIALSRLHTVHSVCNVLNGLWFQWSSTYNTWRNTQNILIIVNLYTYTWLCAAYILPDITSITLSVAILISTVIWPFWFCCV